MLHVVTGQVEPRVSTVEDDDVEVRVQFDQAAELGQLRDGRRRDRVDWRVVEGHAAVAEAATGDADMRPGPRPGFRTAAVAGRAGVDRAHCDSHGWSGSR